MAHRLSLLPGKCEQIHGHSWWVELEIIGPVNGEGIIFEFGAVKRVFRSYLDFEYDHHLLLNDSDPIAVLDVIHVRFDQQDAATAAFRQVFLGGGIGHVVALEPRPFVFDNDLRLLRRDRASDVNLFRRVELVPVLDRVDQDFLQRQLDREGALMAVAVTLHVIEDLCLNLATGGEIGRDGKFHG